MTRKHLRFWLIPAVTLLVAAAPTWAQKGQDAGGLTRQQLAAALARALGGTGYTPPDCVPGEEMFDDVPASSPFCPWIEELARRGLTSGCGGGNYCPGGPVTRAQVAPFLVKTQSPAETPVGVTVTGYWGFDAESDGTGDWGTAISYPAPMPAILSVQFVEPEGDPTEECPGSADLPLAAPGFLCVYGINVVRVEFDATTGNSPFGTNIHFDATGEIGDAYASGTWAATAATAPTEQSRCWASRSLGADCDHEGGEVTDPLNGGER